MHFILDVHNIIYSHPHLSKLMRSYKNTAQKSFLDSIEDYARKYKTYKFTLVYDGLASAVHSSFNNIIIVKSGSSKTADEIIKHLIRKEKSHKLCTVVSSDTEIYNYARINGCKALASKKFIEILKSAASHISTKSNSVSEKPQSVSKSEIDELLKKFTSNTIE